MDLPLEGGARRTLVRTALVAGILVVVVIAALFVRSGDGSGEDLAAVVMTAADGPEVSAAIEDLVARPDPAAMRLIASAASSDAVVSARLEAISGGLIDRLGDGDPDARIAILEALVPIDDGMVAATLVDSVVADDDASVRAAATDLIVELDAAEGAAIHLLIRARSDDRGDATEIDRVLLALGEPAVDAVADLGLREPWTLAFLEAAGRSPLEPLREAISSGRLTALEKATYQLIELEKTDPEAAAPLWRELVPGLRGLVSPKPSLATYLADMLHDVERVRPDLVRPVQKRIVDVLLPRLGQSFAVSDALAHVGEAAFARLLEVARSGTQFMSQELATRVDHARLALTSMVTVRPRAIQPLLDGLKRKDYELVADLMLFYISVGKPGSEPVLLEALDRYPDTILALQLLNSGNPKLASGTREWAARNGYTITGSYSGPGSWGTAGPP